jgi:uncharacterized protein YegJ (DUF2314 family)
MGFALAVTLALPACRPDLPDGFVVSAADDPALRSAMAEARASLPIFWSKFEEREPETGPFWLKVGMPTPNGAVEHIWVDAIARDEGVILGRLVNEPVDLRGLRLGSEVRVRPEMISDWSYEKNGKMYGAYTTRAVLDRVGPEERAQAKALLAPTPLEPDAR